MAPVTIAEGMLCELGMIWVWIVDDGVNIALDIKY